MVSIRVWRIADSKYLELIDTRDNVVKSIIAGFNGLAYARNREKFLIYPVEDESVIYEVFLIFLFLSEASPSNPTMIEFTEAL
ncbi:hypothetical protein ACS0TY_017652 [Phlomoides rotata]